MSTPVETAADVHVANDYCAYATPGISSTTSVTPIQSQEDESRIMEMWKNMDSLLAVLGDANQEEHKGTKLRRRVYVHVPAAT